MRPADQIKKIVKNMNTKASVELDRRVHSSLDDKLAQSPPAAKPPDTWRRIMKSNITKLAAAAVIIAGVVLGVTVFDKTTPTAYAFEQTIDAVRNVRFVHLIMTTDEGKIGDERWIEIGDDGRQNRYRQEADCMGYKLLIVDDRKTVFYYDKVKNEVTIYNPDKRFQWIGNLREFFEEIGGEATLTIEENIGYKGRPAHQVRWSNQSCFIDPETRLPIAIGAYEIYYDTPPADIFVIPQIPTEARTIDERNGASGNAGKNDIDKSFRAARLALSMGRYGEAIDSFGKVVEAEPLRNWAWFWMGDAYTGLGDFDAAIDCYGKVIEMFEQLKLVPHYAHVRRGFAYRAKGLEAEAKKDFAVAIPIMIESLRNPAEMEMFDYADDLSQARKQLPEEILAYKMVERLRRITGREFDYEAGHSLAENEKAIAAWEKWWAENAREYSGE